MTTPATAATRVALVPWPAHAVARARARAAGTPCLLVIEPGTPPPRDCGPLEDWTSTDAPGNDIARRIETLDGRSRELPRLATSVVDALPDDEILLFDLLQANLPRATSWEAIATTLPSVDVDRTVRTLGRLLRQAGHVVQRVPGGVLLSLVPAT
jgi:hypothetical protein